MTAFQQLIDSSEALRLFFTDRDDDPWTVKEAHDALNRLVSSDDLVHSVYLVRLHDQTVIHDEYRFALEQFSDRGFVAQALRDRLISPQWERQRLLGPLYEPGGPRWTVPVAQGYPNPRVLGGQGLAVLNLDLGAFRDMLQNQIPEGASALLVLDREGNEVASVGVSANRTQSSGYRVASELTGWSYAAESTIRLLVRYHKAMTELDGRNRHSDLATHITRTVRERLTDTDLSLKGLAAEFNTSISTVSRLFHGVEGVGFAAFLSRERMALAKRLLSDTEEDIADVCTAVGYSNYAAFARAFKREVGLSPGRFRARAS